MRCTLSLAPAAIEKLFPHTYGQATVDLVPGKTFELGAPLKVPRRASAYR